jgi:hypothetical protein
MLASLPRCAENELITLGLIHDGIFEDMRGDRLSFLLRRSRLRAFLPVRGIKSAYDRADPGLRKGRSHYCPDVRFSNRPFWGQKLPRVDWRIKSALPPKADIRPRDQDVCFGPKGDSRIAANSTRYSITSSAMASIPAGITMPSAFAVIILMTSSNFHRDYREAVFLFSKVQ